ncbi:MAG: hypothetical protein WAZ34_07875 [Rhodocyclaceae bacterium]
MGSSGIRAGASDSQVVTRAEIDYLGRLSSARDREETIAQTISALKELPKEGGFSPLCARVGGGFSAWRLALQQDAGQLVSALARIEAASGVAVLVVPQGSEGAYGYVGARQLLGSRLTTSHVLDIGGGSLQISGERTSFNDQLGQKIWQRELCRAIRTIRDTGQPPCTLPPMTGAELTAARALLANRLQSVRTKLGGSVSMTAISRPVTRGVVPAVARLLNQFAPDTLQRPDLSAAIEALAGLTLAETATRLAIPLKYAAYLLSDMLLVEGLMQAAGTEELRTAEVDMTNLPGLLRDDRAFRWAASYGCYLERLRRFGLDAFASDPETCPGASNP